MIVDAHTHIFPPEICKNREKFFSDKNFKYLYNSNKSKLISANELLNEMDKEGIDYAVAMAFSWNDSNFCKKHNDYMAEAASKSNGRIKTMGILSFDDFENIDLRIKEFKEIGLSGIGEIGFYIDDLKDKKFIFLDRIFSEAWKNDLPVNLHLNEPVGHKYIGKYNPEFEKLYTIINNNPNTKIILAHWGGGLFFYELMPEVKKIFKNIYYDFAASPFLYDDAIYTIALKILEEGKIFFGTDFPLLKSKRYINALESKNLDKKCLNQILGLNAKTFFDF